MLIANQRKRVRVPYTAPNENYKPTPEELNKWREVFSKLENDKDFKIFSHTPIEIINYDIKIKKDINENK